jgi:hypothetical protein
MRFLDAQSVSEIPLASGPDFRVSNHYALYLHHKCHILCSYFCTAREATKFSVSH